MVRKYYELSCDNCGCADFYLIGQDFAKAARSNGWIITKDKKHYDTLECYKEAKNKKEVGVL